MLCIGSFLRFPNSLRSPIRHSLTRSDGIPSTSGPQGPRVLDQLRLPVATNAAYHDYLFVLQGALARPCPFNVVRLPTRSFMPTGTIANLALAEKLLAVLDTLSGLHPGQRPAHAKGLMCSGTFAPSSEAAKLTRAPHASRP